MIPFRLSVDTQASHFLCQSIVIGKHRAAVSITSQRFCGEKTCSVDIAVVDFGLAFVGGSKGLGTVDNDFYI